MVLQWTEDEKLEEVMQKPLDLVVHERMSQGEKVTGAKVKKNVR